MLSLDCIIVLAKKGIVFHDHLSPYIKIFEVDSCIVDV